MSFQALSPSAEKQLERQLRLRQQVEAADSVVALAKAKARIAASFVRRIDAGHAASDAALARALEDRAASLRMLRRALGARHLLLSRLVRSLGGNT